LAYDQQAHLKAIKKEHGAKKLGDVTVDMAIGGMRGIPVRETGEPGDTRSTNLSFYTENSRVLAGYALGGLPAGP
jgi:hypothetical protein